MPLWIKKAKWIADPILENNLTDFECKVFDLALAGICGGDIKRIWEMDTIEFGKLYDYYSAKQELKNAWAHIAHHQQLEETEKIKHKK